MKKFGLTETNLFLFHRIFKTGRGGGSSETPESLWIRHCCMGINLFVDEAIH